MEYTQLGRSGLTISKLVLGTMNFLKTTEESESFRIMDRALELGINFFDTADVYGAPWGNGLGEELMGRWISQGSRRDKFILATKCYLPMGPGKNDRGLSAYHIKRACEDSLRRLKTDHIDIYQMHHVDRTTPWEETWQAYDQLIREGKITYVGSSNHAGWDIATGQMTAKAMGLYGLVSEQSKYCLTVRAIEREVIPACEHFGLGLLVWGAVDQGLLAGVIRGEPEGRRREDFIQKQIESRREQLTKWEDLCDELGEHPALVAQMWVLHQPGVTAPIIGPRTLEHLETSMRMVETRLGDDFLKKLDEIFPPAGEAPSYYAW